MRKKDWELAEREFYNEEGGFKLFLNRGKRKLTGAETGGLKKGKGGRGWGYDDDGAGNRVGRLCALIRWWILSMREDFMHNT